MKRGAESGDQEGEKEEGVGEATGGVAEAADVVVYVRRSQ